MTLINSVSRSTRPATSSKSKAKAAPSKTRARTASRTAKAKPKARKIPGGKAALKSDLKAALDGQYKNLATDLLEWIFECAVNYAHAWESNDPRQTVEDAFGIALQELLPAMAREYHTKAAVADMYGSNFGLMIYGAKSMFTPDKASAGTPADIRVVHDRGMIFVEPEWETASR